MESIFFNIIGISITISFILILLLLLSSYLDERYAVKWRYYIWLILAIRLVVPVDFGLTAPPLELNFSDQEIIYPFGGNLLPQESSLERRTLERGVYTSLNEGMESINDLEDVDAGFSEKQKTTSDTITVSRLALGIYLLGIALFLLWQLGLYFSFQRATKRWYREVSDGKIREILEKVKSEMGIEKQFQIMACRKILSPMIVGLFRPTLLLPHEGYQKIDLEVILKHELVHFKRNDLWYKLLLICANALHWFNPFIYALIREANKDIEISCDEEVLKGADQLLRKRYSERILELMQGNNHQEPPVSTNFNGGKGMLKSRMRNIFDERIKKRGILSFLLILTLILVFSACRIEMGQDKWKIPIAMKTADAYGQDESGSRNSMLSDTDISLPFDLDRDGAMETTFSFLITEEAEACYLKYNGERVKTDRIKVLEGVEHGVVYSLQAANLEDGNSILFLISVDYHSMPFGSGYWEIYSWGDGGFERVDMESVEENLQLKILEPAEIESNTMNAGAAAYLYDRKKYPVDYPVAGLYFKDGFVRGAEKALDGIVYAPLSEYDVEGYQAWGQEAINKTMTGLNFVSGETVEGWIDPSRALLETEEVVFITLPNITASVKRYYQYQDGKWTSVDTYIE